MTTQKIVVLQIGRKHRQAFAQLPLMSAASIQTAQLNTKKITLTNSAACPTVAAVLRLLTIVYYLAPRNQTVSSLGRSAARPPLPVLTTRTVFSLERDVAKCHSPRMCAFQTRRIAKSSARLVVLESQLNALRMTCSLVIVAQIAHHHLQQLQLIHHRRPNQHSQQLLVLLETQPTHLEASPHAVIGILPGWIKSQ